MCQGIDDIIDRCNNSPKSDGIIRRLRMENKACTAETEMFLDTSETLRTVDFAMSPFVPLLFQEK
jgi:hypothetical protein